MEQWYNNKELYEMISGLKTELSEAIIVIREYNGLRKKLVENEERLQKLESHVAEKTVEKTLKKKTWFNFSKICSLMLQTLGWIVALLIYLSQR